VQVGSPRILHNFQVRKPSRLMTERIGVPDASRRDSSHVGNAGTLPDGRTERMVPAASGSAGVATDPRTSRATPLERAASGNNTLHVAS
jgi:hypothetical protein